MGFSRAMRNKRTYTRVGDVFSVPLEGRSKKYFQYIANDITQLNSDVVRAFKQKYSNDTVPELLQVVADEVDFYAHVVINWGLKLELWEKVGSVPYLEHPDVTFRDSRDYGKQVKVSSDWRVWKINERFRDVGRLDGEYKKAEIGIVVTPGDLVIRMQTGEYDFVYPEY
jgi:hypothetical protein